MSKSTFPIDFYIRVSLGPQVQQDRMGSMDLKEILALREALVLLDHQDQWASKDHLDQ